MQIPKKMLPQYRKIRDFDLYENQTQDMIYFSAPVFHKDDFLIDTQDNQLESMNNISKTRSVKTKTQNFESSFGQNFMEQHSIALKKILQKLMEICYPHLKKVQGKSLAYQIFLIEEENACGEQKLKNLIVKDNKYLEQKEKKKFMTDLFYEQKLSEFLSNLCGLAPSPLAMELIFVANLFWQSYIPKQQIGMSEDQINNFVDSLLETDNLGKYLEKIEFLNFKQAQIAPEINQKSIEQALNTFLKKFGVTILLLCQEYFINSYSKEDDGFGNMKRSLNFKDISNDEFSDDQDEIKFCFGHKKRNM